MKISVAQTRPARGDIHANIASHKALTQRAAAAGAEVIVFPELSLTGYEPTLASELATELDDPRFGELQSLSDEHTLVIAAGMPTRAAKRCCISLLLFRPQLQRGIYSKTFLHEDEEPFFVPGRIAPQLQIGETKIALAICYEISVPEHLTRALQLRPDIYIASVAKSASGIDKALARLAQIAKVNTLPVIMSNCVGPADGGECAGRSSAWNQRGELIGQLDDHSEGLLTVDTNNLTSA
jgi:predicted amidohydrolase